MRDFSTKLVPLLEDDIRVMIYAGMADSPTQPCHVERDASDVLLQRTVQLAEVLLVACSTACCMCCMIYYVVAIEE